MKKLFSIMLWSLFVFAGCQSDQSDEVQSSIYEGKNLSIGIVGKKPEVREKNVSFTSLTMEQIRDKELLSHFDAVIFTKEHLQAAAEHTYKQIYQTANIPFFFLESKKAYLLYSDMNISYEQAPDVTNGEYATGFLQKNNHIEYWGFGLYNDKRNAKNIQDVYTRMFQTISSVKNIN